MYTKENYKKNEEALDKMGLLAKEIRGLAVDCIRESLIEDNGEIAFPKDYPVFLECGTDGLSYLVKAVKLSDDKNKIDVKCVDVDNNTQMFNLIDESGNLSECIDVDLVDIIYAIQATYENQ